MEDIIDRFLLKTKKKKAKSQAEIDRCNRNWPLHKDQCLRFFNSVQAASRRSGFSFQVVDAVEVRKEIKEFCGGVGFRRYGEDNIALTFALSVTGVMTEEYTEDGYSIKHQKEKGASLVIHHRYTSALTHVYIIFPRVESEVENAVKPVIVYYTYNMDCINLKLLAKSLRKLFVAQRVGGVRERSSVIDRARVRWWKFKDVRNRQVIEGKVHKLLTAWEIFVIAALVAAATLIATVWPLLISKN